LGVRVVIVASATDAPVSRAIATALESEGADVFLEHLDNANPLAPGRLTTVLEAAEIVVVLASCSPQPEAWLTRELEAAMWRFIVLPGSVEVIPVAVDGAAVAPVL